MKDNLGLSRKCSRDWESQKYELEKAINKDFKYRIRGNKTSITLEKEEELITWTILKENLEDQLPLLL